MVDPTQVFDLQSVLVNELVGSVVLFVILGLIGVVWFGTKYNVPFGASFLLAMIFLMVIVVAYAQSYPLIWVLVITVVGLVFYVMMAKVMKR